jgi:hypothetical protein
MNTCRRLALRYTELLAHLAALLRRAAQCSICDTTLGRNTARKDYYRDTTLLMDVKLKL